MTTLRQGVSEEAQSRQLLAREFPCLLQASVGRFWRQHANGELRPGNLADVLDKNLVSLGFERGLVVPVMFKDAGCAELGRIFAGFVQSRMNRAAAGVFGGGDVNEHCLSPCLPLSYRAIGPSCQQLF
jgi:hypothetical protein